MLATTSTATVVRSTGKMDTTSIQTHSGYSYNCSFLTTYITYHICTYCIAVLFIVQKHVPMYSTHLIIHVRLHYIEPLLKDTAYTGHNTHLTSG